MKIIHGNDFYDGAGWGVDEKAVFLRQKGKCFSELEHLQEHPFNHPKTLEFDSGDILLKPFLVVIAGELHPGLHHQVKSGHRWVRGKHTWHDEENSYIYNAEEALSLFDRLEGDTSLHRWPYYNSAWRKKWREALRQHFEAEISKTQNNWLLDNKIALMSTSLTGERDIPIWVYANHALLKDLTFFKCVDPATIHMRLSNYISGVLPSNREIISLGNTDRIRKAGFDTKISFRKAPQK